jgi:Limonene-1,2-epoxide hydrolase catalytic domain
MAKMISSINIEVKALVANGGTVMTERVDTFEIQGKPFGLEVAAVFEVDSDSRIKRWRVLLRPEVARRPHRSCTCTAELTVSIHTGG